MGRKGSGEKAQSLDPRRARLEGGAKEGRERGTVMEMKNAKRICCSGVTVMKGTAEGKRKEFKDGGGRRI